MNIIKNFAIFKKDTKGNDKLPTHSISAKIGDEYVDLGGCWTKEGQKGKFLSAKLSDSWVSTTDNTKSRKSYVIVAEDDLIELENLANQAKALTGLKGEKVSMNPFGEDDIGF